MRIIKYTFKVDRFVSSKSLSYSRPPNNEKKVIFKRRRTGQVVYINGVRLPTTMVPVFEGWK